MRRLSTAVVAAATLACCASPASAEPQVLATTTANVPISAAGGWVGWSVLGEGGWRLVAWHRGVVKTLPTAPRPQPFDVDLGTDSSGRIVATFSRCTRTPESLDGRTAAWTGADCHVRVLDVASGAERAAGVRRPAGSSDTTPSMWRGRIAFARRDRKHGEVAQVMLWSPRKRRLETLRHGVIPSNCPFLDGCRGLMKRGAVEGLDLGARLVTFLWQIVAPGAFGHGGWEVRADRLPSGRSVLAGAGFQGEVCTGGTDTIRPSIPAADGDRVWYSELTSSCYRNTASVVRYDARRRSGAAGTVPGDVTQLAKDGDALYALVAPRPQEPVPLTCAAPGAPCTIQRLDPPALTRAIRRPKPPVLDPD